MIANLIRFPLKNMVYNIDQHQIEEWKLELKHNIEQPSDGYSPQMISFYSTSHLSENISLYFSNILLSIVWFGKKK